MSNTFTIRSLGIADIQDYRAIRLASLRCAPDAFGSVHDIEAQKPITQHGERLLSSVILGAYDGTNIVGMIGLKQDEGLKDCHKAFLWGFYVALAYRNHGVGTSLLAEMLEIS